MMMLDRLAASVGEEWVREGKAIAEYTVDGATPELIAWPGTVEELAEALRLAHEAGWVVVPAGHGMGLTLGNPLERVDLVISTIRLNRVLDYEPADLTASVQAGCSLETFNLVVGREGQWLPLDPPRPAQASLGAVAAVGEFGSLRLGFGLPRDYVIGLQIVQADGRQLKTGGRVVKNVAGYDLNKLFVGSLGTLGVITQINLKLRPRPEADASLIISTEDITAFHEYMRSVAATEALPVAMCLMSAGTAEQLAVPCPAAHAALLTRFMESEPGVRTQARRLTEVAGQHRLHVERIPQAIAERVWFSIRDFCADPQAQLVLRVNALPSETVSLFNVLEPELQGLAEEVDVLAHPMSGIVWTRLRLRPMAAPGEELVDRLRRIRRHCQQHGGHLIIERAPVELKQQVEVWGEVGATAQMMRALKETFDPRHILNPGRFVAGI